MMSRTFAVTALAAMVGAHLAMAVGVACIPPTQVADSAIFAAELEHCMQTSASCTDYIACQNAVQKRWNQPLSGSCDVIVDGSAE